MFGLVPIANSPTYLFPSEISNKEVKAELFVSDLWLITLPFSNVRITFENCLPEYRDGTLNLIVPFRDFKSGAINTSPSGIFIFPLHITALHSVISKDKLDCQQFIRQICYIV